MVPRIYSPPVHEGKDTVELAEDTVRYLRNVLRLGRGDEILLFDGSGWEYRGVIDRLEGREGTARIVARERIPLEIPVRITLAQALPKGDKMEFIVQKATELGVARIVPFRSARSIPRRTEERAARRLERWRRIAAEAAEQCGRADVPEIAEVRHAKADVTELGLPASYVRLRVLGRSSPGIGRERLLDLGKPGFHAGDSFTTQDSGVDCQQASQGRYPDSYAHLQLSLVGKGGVVKDSGPSRLRRGKTGNQFHMPVA